jgi:hypothetical protein
VHWSAQWRRYGSYCRCETCEALHSMTQLQHDTYLHSGYLSLLGRPDEKRKLGSPNRGWKDNMKMKFKTTERGHALHLSVWRQGQAAGCCEVLRRAVLSEFAHSLYQEWNKMEVRPLLPFGCNPDMKLTPIPLIQTPRAQPPVTQWTTPSNGCG